MEKKKKIQSLSHSHTYVYTYVQIYTHRHTHSIPHTLTVSEGQVLRPVGNGTASLLVDKRQSNI